MGALRLHLYKQTLSPSVKESDAEEYSMYKEALSFDGGLSFADDESLVIQKKDGSIFESAITHYETDDFTVTYVGHFPNGKPFRFLFGNYSGPLGALLQQEPTITIASMSTSGWAVHFRAIP